VLDYCERKWNHLYSLVPPGASKVAGKVLNRIAQAHSARPTQTALTWLLRRSPIMLPISGISSIEHLELNVAAASLRLPDEDYKRFLGVPSCRITTMTGLVTSS